MTPPPPVTPTPMTPPPYSSFLDPSHYGFDAESLGEIEALEPAAVLSLVSFKRDVRDDGSDWAPPPPRPKKTLEYEEVSSSSPPPMLPPKKRIRRKYIIETEGEGPRRCERADPIAANIVPEEASVPSTLYAIGDEDHINPIHNIIRRDILEVFVESPRRHHNNKRNNNDDNDDNGENEKKASSGQCGTRNTGNRFAGRIGLRCRFCKHIPETLRPRLSTIYPETLGGIYRACSVRFQKRHLKECQFVPDVIRDDLEDRKDNASRGSKNYWVESALMKGFRDSDDGKGIVFCPVV